MVFPLSVLPATPRTSNINCSQPAVFHVDMAYFVRVLARCCSRSMLPPARRPRTRWGPQAFHLFHLLGKLHAQNSSNHVLP